MENWLPIAVLVYLLAMVLYGHYRGFIRLAVSVLALVVSLAAVRFSLPMATEFIKENTAIEDAIAENMIKWSGIRPAGDLTEGNFGIPAAQRTLIENSDLPETIKTALIENNNNEVYELLGVQAFADYIGKYLADMILNSVIFLILFLFAYLAIRLIMRWLDIIARLPVLSGINKLAGACLGGVEGLVFLWIAFLVLTALSGTPWGMAMTRQIEASKWLSYLYNNNFLNIMVLSVFQKYL